MSKDEFA